MTIGIPAALMLANGADLPRDQSIGSGNRSARGQVAMVSAARVLQGMRITWPADDQTFADAGNFTESVAPTQTTIERGDEGTVIYYLDFA